MRGLVFPGHDLHIDVGEAGLLEQPVQLGLAETEPGIGVELAGLLELMGKEVQDGDASASLEETMGGGEGALGVVRMMEGLAEESEIDAAR